jgi:hypothetical protein
VLSSGELIRSLELLTSFARATTGKPTKTSSLVGEATKISSFGPKQLAGKKYIV